MNQLPMHEQFSTVNQRRREALALATEQFDQPTARKGYELWQQVRQVDGYYDHILLAGVETAPDGEHANPDALPVYGAAICIASVFDATVQNRLRSTETI
jgi:hypothetical protein